MQRRKPIRVGYPSDVTETTLLAARPASVGAMLVRRVEATSSKEAFRYVEDDRWVSLSWLQTKDKAFQLAAGLLALGIGPEDRVAIASSTRMEWILADLAIMCAAGATTTIYPSTQHEDVGYILADSQSKVVFAEDDLQVGKVLDHLDELPELINIVQLDGKVDHPKVIGWADLERLGREHLDAHPTAVDDVIAAIGPEDLATLIYTSGTTGRPKGVRLVQDCWTYEGAAVEAYDIISADDLQYLWLPLSHVFGKALIAIQLYIGFTTAVDGRIDKIVENLGVVQPTFMCGAPRIFEKVRARVMMTASHGVKAKIFDWAFRGRPQGITDAVGGRGAIGAACPAVRTGGPPRLQQDQSQDGWQDQVLRFWLRCAESGGAGMVPRSRAARAGGLRPH